MKINLVILTTLYKFSQIWCENFFFFTLLIYLYYFLYSNVKVEVNCFCFFSYALFLHFPLSLILLAVQIMSYVQPVWFKVIAQSSIPVPWKRSIGLVTNVLQNQRYSYPIQPLYRNCRKKKRHFYTIIFCCCFCISTCKNITPPHHNPLSQKHQHTKTKRHFHIHKIKYSFLIHHPKVIDL